MEARSTFRSPRLWWLILLAGLAYAGYWATIHAFISRPQGVAHRSVDSQHQSDILMASATAQPGHTLRDAEVNPCYSGPCFSPERAAASQQTGANGKGTSASLEKYSPSRGSTNERHEGPQSLKDYIQRATQEERKLNKARPTRELDQQVPQQDSAEAPSCSSSSGASASPAAK